MPAKKTNKKAPNKKGIQIKEDSASAIWIPTGIMIGAAVGLALSFSLNNFIYLGLGAAFGLLLGIIIGSGSKDNSKKK